MIKVAFGSVPKDGGTFTFYRNQRAELLKRGIDLRCVTVGFQDANKIDPDFVDSGCYVIAENVRSVKAQAIAFVDWCVREEIDIVFGINSRPILSALPHLPSRIRVLARCANGFDHGFKITLCARERLMGIIALTPRLSRILIDEYDADPEMVKLITNGVDSRPFEMASFAERGARPELQLGFLGRLEHNQKGVLYLPEILCQLHQRGVSFKLRIAGRGRHEPDLRAQLAKYDLMDCVEFVGRLNPDQVPAFLQSTDVLLFTSHFEGCPNVLLEAAMAGCVPVSWLIEGTTDFIIEEGRSGFLCEMANITQFALAVQQLSNDRKLLVEMSNAMATAARANFTNQICSERYSQFLKEIMRIDPIDCVVKPWSGFEVDRNFRVSLFEWLPSEYKERVKRLIRRLRGVAISRGQFSTKG